MSLEQKIETLTTEIVSLKETIASIIANGAAAPAATGTAETKADAKGAAKGGAKGGKTTTTTKEDKPTSVRTLAELQKVLADYKEVFGLPAAKKVLPDLGYENSKAVPADKIDEVFDHVNGLLKAEADKDGGEYL